MSQSELPNPCLHAKLSWPKLPFKLIPVRLAFDCNRNITQLTELGRRYGDRNPDLADLCLIRMSELYPRHVVITVDSDFRFYRRHRREVIPIHAPPQQL